MFYCLIAALGRPWKESTDAPVVGAPDIWRPLALFVATAWLVISSQYKSCIAVTELFSVKSPFMDVTFVRDACRLKVLESCYAVADSISGKSAHYGRHSFVRRHCRLGVRKSCFAVTDEISAFLFLHGPH